MFHRAVFKLFNTFSKEQNVLLPILRETIQTILCSRIDVQKRKRDAITEYYNKLVLFISDTAKFHVHNVKR